MCTSNVLFCDLGNALTRSCRHTLGAAGNRTGVTELNGRTIAYTYDDLYRLTSETIAGDPKGKNGAVSYAYDPVGNRQSLTSTLNAVPAGTFYYDANDRFTGFGADQYDANGNTVASAGITNVYDFENHLIQHGGITYQYDGDGNRVAKTIGGVKTTYLVDDQASPTGYAQVVEEMQNGVLQGAFVYGPMRAFAMYPIQTYGYTTPVRFYGYDGHGSVRYLTDETGAVVHTYDYDAFGNVLTETDTPAAKDSSGHYVIIAANEFMFAGEQFDADLGLYYNRARYLDVRKGRFWGMDSYEGSVHKYLYASADPCNRVDPTGNDDLVELGAYTATQSVLQTMAVQAAKGALLGGLFGGVDAALQGKERRDILLAAAKGGLLGAVVGPLTKIKFVAPVLVAIGTAAGFASTVDAFDQKNLALATFRAASVLIGARTFVDEPIPSGGRLGTADTRFQLREYSKFLEARGWRITGGGGVAPEEYLPGEGPGTRGSNWVDLTAEKNGVTLRVNTISTLSDGITPTPDEAAAAALIRSKINPNDPFVLIPKWSLPDWYQATR